MPTSLQIHEHGANGHFTIGILEECPYHNIISHIYQRVSFNPGHKFSQAAGGEGISVG